MIDLGWTDEFDQGPNYIAPKCVIGLDRDGVINKDLGTYCYRSKDFEPIEGSIDGLYYSASSRKNDMYAKPNIGMFKRCEREVPHVKFNQGYYVGDKLSDLKASMKIGAKPVLVRTGYGKETEELINKRFTYKQIKKRTIVFDTLSKFADYVIN